MSQKILAGAAGAVSLSGATTRVPLAPVAGAEPLDRSLAKLAGASRFFLVLSDLRANEPPGIIYELYLGLPPGAAPNPNDAHYVGTLNFFAVQPPNKAPKSRSYDVTDIVNATLMRHTPTEGLAVTIVAAAGSPSGSTAAATIGQLTLVAQ